MDWFFFYELDEFQSLSLLQLFCHRIERIERILFVARRQIFVLSESGQVVIRVTYLPSGRQGFFIFAMQKGIRLIRLIR